MTTTALRTIEGEDLIVEFKSVTIREVYEALENDGFEHLRGMWFDRSVVYGNGYIQPEGGCVLGQTALNLGVAATHDLVHIYLQSQKVGYEHRRDIDSFNLYTQLNKFDCNSEHRYFERWIQPIGEEENLDEDDLFSVPLGDVIIRWNDKPSATYDDDGKYQLETYADVAQMAKEVMEPFFDETIQLMVAVTE